MPTQINGYSPSQETPLSSLVINEVDSNETFEKMKEKGILQDNQLYLVTDELSGGGVDIPASDTEPATGNYWLDTSAEGGTYYTAGEVDTLLQNKAPAGYGLGTTAKNVTDFNVCVENGWYCGAGASNAPSFSKYASYGLLLVIRQSGAVVIQRYFAYLPGNGITTPTIAMRASADRGSTWTEWEYENPPMELGVEYRTTERYKGKPVYIKAVDTGALPNATFKSVAASFSNANAIVDYGGEAYRDADHFIPLPCLKYGVDSYNNEKGVQVTISNGYSIIIATMTDFSSFTSSSVWAKYTKTTD